MLPVAGAGKRWRERGRRGSRYPATSGLPLSLPQGPPPPPRWRCRVYFCLSLAPVWQHCKVAKLSKWPQLSHVAATEAGAACSIVCWLPLHVPVASAVCAALEGKPIKHVINKITENFRKSPRCGLNKHSTKAQKEKQN